MAFQKGKAKTGGKVKGTPNKLTRTVKELVLEVFNKLQTHPTANLEAFAESNPKDFYLIAAKLIPTEVGVAIVTDLFVIVPPDPELTIDVS